MPTQADDPLRKVTLNLYADDCEWMEKTFGRGWTEHVRRYVHAAVLERTHYGDMRACIEPRRTLGDLE